MGEEGSAGDANPWFRQKRVEEERGGGLLLLRRKQYPLTFSLRVTLPIPPPTATQAAHFRLSRP